MISYPINDKIVHVGTAAERATFSAAAAGVGAEFWETDGNKNEYKSDGAAWTQIGAGGSKFTSDQSVGSVRNANSATESVTAIRSEWKRTVVNASTPTAISADGQAVIIGKVRVAGTANLGGACSIESGTIASRVASETILSGAIPGAELDMGGGALFDAGCVVTVATSGSVIVFWRNK